MILVSPPQRRRDHYFSLITDDRKHKFKLCFGGAHWINLHHVEADGCVLRLSIPPECEAAKTILSIDAALLSNTIDKSADWFPNSLSEEQVRQYFRPSIDNRSSAIALYVSPSQDPLVTLNRRPVDGIHSLGTLPSNARVRAEIEAFGVMFFRQRFGVRWRLRKLWVDTLPLEVEECAEEWADRAAVENSWDQDMVAFYSEVEAIKDAHMQKIRALEAIQAEARTKWDSARQQRDLRLWNQILEDLARYVAKQRTFLTKT